MPATPDPTVQLSRRAFLHGGSLLLLSATCRDVRAAGEQDRMVRAGLVTDLHHADKPARGTRYYRETLTKLGEAVDRLAAASPDFLVELGDFIDAADSVETEQRYLQQVNEVFARFAGPRHYVLGNHCVDTLTKREFLDGVGRPESFYSFDAGGVHFIVLDSCFRADGQPYGRKNSVWTDANIPQLELDWLRADLAKTGNPAVVLAHQRLDDAGKHAVRNAGQVRQILQDSHKVLAVFQGHSHRNQHQEIGGIHYCTLVAIIEGTGPDSSGYATLDVLEGGTLRLTGFRNQQAYHWENS